MTITAAACFPIAMFSSLVFLLEVKFPDEFVCWSVGWLVDQSVGLSVIISSCKQTMINLHEQEEIFIPGAPPLPSPDPFPSLPRGRSPPRPGAPPLKLRMYI